MKTKTKRKAGQPSKINSVDLSKVTIYAANGYTDKRLSEIFNVKRQTICNWKKSYPEFFDTLKKGKLIADAKVEVSLYQRACGYSHPEVHISNYQGKITKTPIIKHYPPDPTSMIFWLKNRKPQDWRDMQEKGGDTHIHFTSVINHLHSLVDKKEDTKPNEEAKPSPRFDATRGVEVIE